LNRSIPTSASLRQEVVTGTCEITFRVP